MQPEVPDSKAPVLDLIYSPLQGVPMQRAGIAETPRCENGRARMRFLSIWIRLHASIPAMALYTIGGASRDASDASKKSVLNARLQKYASENMVCTRKTLHRDVYEGSCKF